MKSSIVALLLSLTSLSAFATTTLKVPMFIEVDGNETITAAEFNAKYKLKGDAKIVEVFEIQNTKESLSKSYKLFWSEGAKLDDFATKSDKNFNLMMQIPGKEKGTCYEGKPSEAVDIVSSMSDSIYSDQLGVIGYKYKDQTVILEGDADEIGPILESESKLWKEWRGHGEAILILSHESDGGDDVNEGIITKCK